MANLKIGWFQPLSMDIDDADYSEHYPQLWEQLEWEYEQSLTFWTKIRHWIWKIAYQFIEYQRGLLQFIEP